MNILVTGGSGFIGKNLIPFLLSQYPSYKVVNLDKESPADGERKNLYFVKGDIADAGLVEDVILRYEIQTVINLAFEPSQAETFIRSDIEGQYILLGQSREKRVGKFLYLSSDRLYPSVPAESFPPGREEVPPLPVVEEMVLSSKNLEAAAKIAAESLASSFFRQYDLPVTVIRSASCFGPYQNREELIPSIVMNALEEKPIPIYGGGKMSQDWLYVKDLVSALNLALHKKEARGGIFNIGLGDTHTVLEITELILASLNKPKSLVQMVEEEVEIESFPPLDCSKAEKILGWKVGIDFVQGLKESIKWYKENKGWWK